MLAMNKTRLHRTLRVTTHNALGKTLKGVREMYLRKVEGPRSVTLPDGTIITRADLPSPDTRRWVASRKAIVVQAVAVGLITQKDAQERYGLSQEEFTEWQTAVKTHGVAGLRATALKRYRQP